MKFGLAILLNFYVTLKAIAEMFLSIVTPTFNSEKYILRCINSVRDQNVSNYEHLIIDGNSTDGTLAKLKGHDKVHILSEPDKGQSDALNKGFLLAKGEWILWLNSDDYLLKGAIESFIKTQKQFPEANVIYGHMQYVDANETVFKKIYNIRYRPSFGKYGLYMPPSTGTFFKASFLKQNPLNLDHHYTMDTELFMRCSSLLETRVIDQFTVAFRFWEENKTLANLDGSGSLPIQHQKERESNHRKFIYKSWTARLPAVWRIYSKLRQLSLRPLYYFYKIRATLKSNN